MARDTIPSIEECYELIHKYEMLPNIIAHSEQVMRVSLAIVDNLRNEAAVNRELIIAASLLHDITKTRSLKTGEPHDATGGQLLRELGFHRIADIVGSHVMFIGFNPDGKLEEREIVYYADKRVLHDRIVTIEERVADLVVRYGKTPSIENRIVSNKDLILKIEKKIVGSMLIEIDKAIDNAK